MTEYYNSSLSAGEYWNNKSNAFPGLRKTFVMPSPITARKLQRDNGSEMNQSECPNCKKNKKGVVEVFKKFSDVTSLQGVPFVNRATRSVAKALWTFIFFCAVIMAIAHSFLVISLYMKFETTTQVTIKNEFVNFPSVTFCNVNPALTTLIKRLNVTNWETLVKIIAPPSAYKMALDNVLNQNNKKFSGRAFVGRADVEIANISQKLSIHDSDELLNNKDVSLELKISALVKELIAKTDRDTIMNIAHSLDVMLLECNYDGKVCGLRNFSTHFNNKYGVCWTFNSRDIMDQSLKSVRSGASYGLQMTLYIQEHSYMKGLGQGKGIRLHIHPHNTLPFVVENGVSVAPGTNTYIGMRLINQTHLGGRYGTCNDDGGKFEAYYAGYNYTLTACINTCLDRTISKKCGCYRETFSEYYKASDLKKLRKCNKEADLNCTRELTGLYASGQLDCKCNQACNTIDYELQLSHSSWPDDSLWYMLADTVCQNSKEDCSRLRHVPISDRQIAINENFLQLKIYYRDLNVENINEVQAYEFSQFVSDLGGAVGLWLGASIITIFELVDLSFQLCNYCNRKNVYKQKEKYAHDSTSMNSFVSCRTHSDVVMPRSNNNFQIWLQHKNNRRNYPM